MNNHGNHKQYMKKQDRRVINYDENALKLVILITGSLRLLTTKKSLHARYFVKLLIKFTYPVAIGFPLVSNWNQ